MNGYEVVRNIQELMDTVGALIQRVEVLEQQTRDTRTLLTSVPDPEFDWARINSVEVVDKPHNLSEILAEARETYERIKKVPGVSPPKSVPPRLPEVCYVAADEDLRNVLQQIESDRARDEAYFKEWAARARHGDREVEIREKMGITRLDEPGLPQPGDPYPEPDDQPFVIGGES